MSDISISMYLWIALKFFFFFGKWQEINLLNKNKEVEAEDILFTIVIFMWHEIGISY